MGGPVNATELGTVLWSSYAGPGTPDDPTARPQRPYPSAGAQYVARLRLIVRNVEGLPPGHYDLDPAARNKQIHVSRSHPQKDRVH